MLYATTTDGVRTTGVSLLYNESGGVHGTTVSVGARIHETDMSLTKRWVNAVLYWNDGTGAAVSLGNQSLSDIYEADRSVDYWEISASKRMLPGLYVSQLRIQNFRSPKQDVVNMNFFITVIAEKPVYSPQKLIYGPILPRDSGFPNSQQWDFDIDSDLVVLESSVKMLLLTAKGDRIMEPEYGTNIRRILFDLNLKSVESLLREEIAVAFSRWEPRVELISLVTSFDPNSRSVSLDMTLASKLTKQPFETRVQYSR